MLAQATLGAPPNLLWIMADDLGAGEPGFTLANSSHGRISTPHIDKLASESMRELGFDASVSRSGRCLLTNDRFLSPEDSESSPGAPPAEPPLLAKLRVDRAGVDIHVDRGAFMECYARIMMRFTRLTMHQREKLEAVRRAHALRGDLEALVPTVGGTAHALEVSGDGACESALGGRRVAISSAHVLPFRAAIPLYRSRASSRRLGSPSGPRLTQRSYRLPPPRRRHHLRRAHRRTCGPRRHRTASGRSVGATSSRGAICSREAIRARLRDV